MSTESTPRERLAFCLVDFANSAFPTVALTAFGGRYYQEVLVGDAGLTWGPVHVGPTAAWSLAMSLSMLLVTLTSPVMGALADGSGKKRRYLAVYTGLAVAATYGLAFVRPGAGWLALALYVLANFAFEGAYVFYNSFLPELAPPERVGRLSGAAWATGYGGGLLALAACLPILPKSYDAAHAASGSLVYVLVATWFLLFSVPALLWLRDRGRRALVPAGAEAQGGERAAGVGHGRAADQRSGCGGETTPPGLIATAFREVASTLTHIRAHRAIVVFLVAYFLYNDAITTVIGFTGIYTGEVLAFTPRDNIILFLVMNGVALPGTLAFGWLVDRVGGQRTIRATLVVWTLVVVGCSLATTKAAFWPVAFGAALVIGATQAASRAVMANLAPRERMGEFMGFLSLSGKGSSIAGPLLYGFAVEAAREVPGSGGGHRVAIALIGGLFVAAFFVMGRLPRAARVAVG